ncbi:MAG: VanZ family protein [Clostridiales bacterium]|nr:VanZ family protein [Clostridiales bacterium]
MAGNRSSAIAHFLLLLFRILFTVFAVGTTVFIFSNSLEIGTVSSARSQEVTALLNRYLAPMGLYLTEAVVRKLAHFAEYTLLAFWFTLCLRVYTRHYIRHISWPLFLVLLVANLDETLQTYVANRNGSIRDVWIDFGGGVTGVLAALVLIMLLGGFWHLLGFGRHREQ